MSADAKCSNCPNYRDALGVVMPVSRQEALKHFIRLQGEGHVPTMCEHDFGEYTVCHTGKAAGARH